MVLMTIMETIVLLLMSLTFVLISMLSQAEMLKNGTISSSSDNKHVKMMLWLSSFLFANSM